MRQSLLLVDDQSIGAKDIAAILADVGIDVAARAQSVDDAIEHIWRTRFDAVLLKAQVDRRPTFEVADWLTVLRVPFVFMTSGPCADVLPPRFKGAPCLRRPFAAHDLVHQVAQATGLLAPPPPLPFEPKGPVKQADLDDAGALVAETEIRRARLEMLLAKYPNPEAELTLSLVRDALSRRRERLAVLERRARGGGA